MKRRAYATVKIRRGEGWPVKPEAEQLDGRHHLFIYGCKVGDDSDPRYAGETLWVADKEGWPDDCEIVFIASGDLEFDR
jgi:hypothetical protein